MDTSTWTTKEKYMSAFWLLCGIALAATAYIQKTEATASYFLQNLGLFFLISSWALSPQFFLQPLKNSINKPAQKPLLFGLAAFFAFQLASLVARLMA